MAEPTILIAFFAGIISFASPCVLPLIPGFLAYLSGTAPNAEGARMKIFLSSVAFVLGFSLVFAVLGFLLSTVLSQVSDRVIIWLGRVGGTAIIIFGLHMLHFIRIPFLEMDHKITVKKKFSINYATSFVFGASFAIGWTPCVGTVLGSILILAIANPAHSFALLLSYALGLGIPFLAIGLFTAQAMAIINRSDKFLKYFNLVSGILLVIIGMLVFTNSLDTAAGLIFRL